MKLSQLQYFQTVCKYNNVTRAAEELHITQPSISNAIKELEAEFGVNLFHRLNKHLSLTNEGAFFLEQASEILKKVNELSERMSDLGNNKNNIKVGVPPMIGTFLFPPIFSGFKKLYPDINLEVQENGSLQTIRQISDDTLDIAIAITNELKDPLINVFNILNTQIYYCVSKSHRLAGCDTVTLDMIKDEPLVLLKPDSYQHTIIKDYFKSHGFDPNVILYSSQLYTIKNFVSNHIATAFLFKEIIDRQDDMIGIPLSDPIDISIGLIWKKNKHMYSDAAKFVQFTQHYSYRQSL